MVIVELKAASPRSPQPSVQRHTFNGDAMHVNAIKLAAGILSGFISISIT